MTFPTRKAAPPPPTPRTLMQETEMLVKSMVRNANKRRRTPDGTGTIPPDVVDQARAASAAMAFMSIKSKLLPDEEVSEYERSLRKYHGQGEGGADPAEAPGTDGAGGTDATDD